MYCTPTEMTDPHNYLSLENELIQAQYTVDNRIYLYVTYIHAHLFL